MDKTISPERFPRHIGVIMDGNGRWAKKRGLPRTAGHSAGANNFKKICLYANEIGVKCMTFYAFSTENWKRPADEVNTLMRLFATYLRDSVNFKDKNIKLTFLGERSRLSEELRQLMDDAERNSADCTGLQVNLAINYGGQDEILNAVRTICREVRDGAVEPEAVTVADLSNHMYTAGMPELDLIIRPSGEYRLSNFLIWQSAYAELWFSDVLWPDFRPKHLDQAIMDYIGRNRRFGGLSE